MLQKMKSCLSTAAVQRQIFNPLFLLSRRQGAYGWNHLTAHTGPLRSVSGRSLKERKILFCLSLPHQRLLPPQEPVWGWKCSPSSPAFCMAVSIFISADSHADLEHSEEFHSSSLMIDELIGHTAKDGRC